MKEIKYIIGIDEAGRGPLAGPVVVAAVALTTKFRIKNAELRIKKKPNSKLAKLRDSKKLSPRQRGNWFRYIKKHQKIFYTTAFVSPKTIDKINISNAANVAASRAFKKLITNYQLPITKIPVFLDGGLYLKNLKPKTLHLKPKTIVKGDEKIPAIALASIIAKVSRDRLMLRLHKKYPKYGFDKHKGYGTKKHIRAIKKHGLSAIHRRSFKIK